MPSWCKSLSCVGTERGLLLVVYGGVPFFVLFPFPFASYFDTLCLRYPIACVLFLSSPVL